MATIQERVTAVERDVENERERRREISLKVDKLGAKVDRMFYTLIGIGVAVVGTLIRVWLF